MRKVILVINCNCSAAIFQQVITTTFFKSQTATATLGMDFSHVRILHLFLLYITFVKCKVAMKLPFNLDQNN